MNVQHFVGVSMREVLTQVRDALGDDALILESRETPLGIEVSAVRETPPGALAGSVESAFPTVEEPLHEAAHDDQSKSPVGQREIDTALAVATEKLASIEDVGAVREEMKSIRTLVESHLAQVGWSEAAVSSPGKASVMRNLSALGIAPDVVRTLTNKIDVTNLYGKTWAAPMKLLMEELPVVDLSGPDVRRIAVVGPPGAGKTTTIAKLAARFAIRESTENLAVVSLDNHRLGASEQIDALARLLGVTVRRPVGDRGVEDIEESIAGKRLTLIDTVGLGQRDQRIHEQTARLGEGVHTLLALPANLEHDAMQQVVDSYRNRRLAGIVLTRIDEAASLGAALSVILRSGVPLAFVSAGQRIPDDLNDAAHARTWLVKHATELMRKRRVFVSDRYMAENFYGARGDEELAEHG